MHLLGSRALAAPGQNCFLLSCRVPIGRLRLPRVCNANHYYAAAIKSAELLLSHDSEALKCECSLHRILCGFIVVYKGIATLLLVKGELIEQMASSAKDGFAPPQRTATSPNFRVTALEVSRLFCVDL